MLTLESVTPENWRAKLAVKEEQKHYVAAPAVILARAYAFRECGSRACMICLDGEPIGMGLYYDYEDEHQYIFSELLIDERYQGHGYGEAAARMMLDEMRCDGRYPEAILCYIEGNEAACRMYEKLGFRHTGEVDEDEVIMKIVL